MWVPTTEIQTDHYELHMKGLRTALHLVNFNWSQNLQPPGVRRDTSNFRWPWNCHDRFRVSHITGQCWIVTGAADITWQRRVKGLNLPFRIMILDSIFVSFLHVPKTESPDLPGKRNGGLRTCEAGFSSAASSPALEDINKKLIFEMDSEEANRVCRPSVRYTLFHPDSWYRHLWGNLERR